MRAHYRSPIQNSSGDIQPGSTIAVYQNGMSALLAVPIWADGQSQTELNNPWITQDGFVNFYLDSPQRVDLVIIIPGSAQITFPDIDVEVSAVSAVDLTLAGSGQNSTAVGANALATAAQAVALGNSASATAGSALAVGQDASSPAASGTALGMGSLASGPQGTAVGSMAQAGPMGVALGYQAISALAASSGTALGKGSSVTGAHSTAIGADAVASGNNQVVLGTSVDQVVTPGDFSAPNAIFILPSGDPSGAGDQAKITAFESAGRNIIFGPGFFVVLGLAKQSSTVWEGSGPALTTIQLAPNANTDVIQSASFSSLTLSGANGAGSGIHDFAIRNMTIDGNKANQAGTSHGIRIYGYTFELRNLHITNCLSTGLYTEWGTGVSPADATEATFSDLKIYGNGIHGWHNRGPHDSRSYNVTIFNDGSGSGGSLLGPTGYWSQDCSGSVAITVAAGSNGTDLSTFTSGSPGTLNVNTTLGYPQASISGSQGSITVATAHSPVVLTYTAVTATSFTGCVAQGSPASGSTVSTGGSVTATGGGYSGNGLLSTAFHVWQGNPQPNYSAILDAQSSDFVLGYFEKGAIGSVLVRGPNCILGECHLPLAGSVGSQCGLQLGDAANVCFGFRFTGDISGYGNSSQATSSVNVVNDSGNNDVNARVQSSGSNTTVIGGSPSTQSRYQVQAMGMSVANCTLAGLDQVAGKFYRAVPSASSAAFVVHEQGTDLANLNTSNSPQQWQWPNGLQHIYFTDAYITSFFMVDGTKGHLVAKSGSGGSLNPAVAAGAQASAASLVSSHSSDIAGTVQATLVASPGSGHVLDVTFAHAFSNTPCVKLTAINSFAALANAFIYAQASTTGFTVFLAGTPPVSVDSQTLQWSYQVMGLDG